MSLSLRLDIKQTQGLVLTPQLQQAIKLLQYTSQELVEAVQNEAIDNPFIQVVPPASAKLSSTPVENVPVAAQANGSTAFDSRLSVRRLSNSGDDDLPSAIDRLSERPTLTSHLLDQLLIGRGDPQHLAIARQLAEMVEMDGYLRASDSELADLLGVAEREIETGRKLLQGCDPTGIGARDLAECLTLQLKERNRFDPAMAKLIDRLPKLARADWTSLERACGVDREDLEEMVAEIKALDPRPGARFASPDIDAVVPDLFVTRKAGGGWRIELNTGALPKILVDETYAAELGSVGGKDAKEFVQQRLQSANWLQKALEQRARTMIRVASAIFKHQIQFLENGPSGLKPLVLREIAEATDLHESTVSRATADKYVQTPRGTYPLKYFFTAAIQSSSGEGEYSAEAIRSKIKDLVNNENPKAILSDDQIVNVLQSQGVAIARRTVAKYRESLRIPSSVQRRRAKSLKAS